MSTDRNTLADTTDGPVLAYRLIAEQIPLGGRGTPVCPPTYKHDSKKTADHFALSEDVPIFDSTDPARLGEPLIGDDGRPLRGDAVVLDSLAARAHAMSQVLFDVLSDVLGHRPPGIYVQAPPTAEVISHAEKAYTGNKLAAALAKVGMDREWFTAEVVRAVGDTFADGRVSTWTASHRHADAAIRYALDPDTGKQVWSGGRGEVGGLIRSASAGDGNRLISEFPASALLGFWLSARSPRAHKLARSLSAEVIGFGASGFTRAATKTDVLGGIPAQQNKITTTAEGIEVSAGKPGKDGERPAAFGFGQIPTEPDVAAVVCESILLRGVFSVQALRSQVRADDDHLSLAEAMGVLALLGGDGAGFRRSGADFVSGTRRLVLVRPDGSTSDADADAVYAAALDQVRAHAGLLGSGRDVQASPEIVSLIAGRVSKGALHGGDDQGSEGDS